MNRFIEKYRLYIGLFLILIIIGGGIFLLRGNGKSSNKNLAEVESLKQQISQQNQDINKLKELLAGLEKQKEEAGKVAGESTSNSNKETPGKININTANAATLDKLPGVGPARAQLIIDYRSQNNGFKSAEEIMKIKGIGEKTYEKMKDMIEI